MNKLNTIKNTLNTPTPVPKRIHLELQCIKDINGNILYQKDCGDIKLK